MARVRHPGKANSTNEPSSPDRDLVSSVETEEETGDGGGNHLRPKTFRDYVGQRPLIQKLKIYVQASKQRDEALDHALFHGPPGLGKTTLAQILVNELGVRLHVTSGPAVEHKGVLAALLTNLSPKDVLFIDEIHRMSPTVEETLYSAMEDRRIDLPVGEGSRARSMSFELPPFTLIGATTRTALLSAPLRDRFHIVEGLQFYEDDDLAKIVARASGLLGVEATPEGAFEIGRRSRGTPRIAIRLTRRIRDFIQVAEAPRIDQANASEHLEKLGVDSAGLDETDRRLMAAIIELFGGGPVGVDAIAASLGEPRDTLEDVHEPFLLQRGFLIRSPRGRMATRLAYRHLGLTASADDSDISG